jgi:hypothetical protein
VTYDRLSNSTSGSEEPWGAKLMSKRRSVVAPASAVGLTLTLTLGVWAGVAAAKGGRHGGRNRQSSACPDELDASGRTEAVACVGGTGTVDSSVTASVDPSSGQGYAVYQGRPGDRIPEGYLGADTQNGLTIVGCDTGSYNPDARDEWNQSPTSKNNNAQIAVGTDEFTAPTGPVGPGDPCSPFVPHTPPGASCGSPQNQAPDTSVPGDPSPLNVYASGAPSPSNPSQSGQVGVAGDFGGGDGATGYLQATYSGGQPTPTGNVTTGGNSRGGGGTVAVGNDGRETDDPYTPANSPVVVCQN